jgi:hypothetical protein
MENNEARSLFERVQSHAFSSLSWRQRQTSNLYVHRGTLAKGEHLGPREQKIVVDRPSILVFVDDQPLSDFGHPCRYLLYDAQTASLYREVHAQFPPFGTLNNKLTLFHGPVAIATQSNLFHIRPRLKCPVPIPDGERYAILFSGMAWMRNLNNIEFSYRMLVDRYGFKPANIYVHLFDGTVNTMNGPGVTWPGDGSPFRVQVTGPGNRTALQGTLNLLKAKLRPADLVFLHTENEAGNDGQSWLASYPNWNTYHAADLAADLSSLGKYRALIALMASCYSGGFRDPILAGSTADATSVACATVPAGWTAVTPDGNFTKFGCDWIAAQIGHDPYGAALAQNPDTDGDGVIEAEEAFNYALSVRNLPDTPNFGESSEAGGDIALGQRHILLWWWCWLILPILERYYYPPQPPDPEFFARLQRILPELRKLVMPTMSKVAAEIRQELTPKIEPVVAGVFEGRSS